MTVHKLAFEIVSSQHVVLSLKVTHVDSWVCMLIAACICAHEGQYTRHTHTFFCWQMWGLHANKVRSNFVLLTYQFIFYDFA
jgi:hypothetical protein